MASLRHLTAVCLFALASGIATGYSRSFTSLQETHPFYLGPVIGYGNTDWNMMVMDCNAHDVFCSAQTVGASAPISASGDDGLVWGVTLGYEFKPSFAFEASYLHFPSTLVRLNDPWNYYMAQGHDTIEFSSETWALFAVGKFMTEIAESGIRGFANAGIDFTARDDVLADTIRVNPTFGVGVNYVFPSNFMLELAFQYMTGYGTADEVPANKYIPFLYSLSLKLLYRL